MTNRTETRGTARNGKIDIAVNVEDVRPYQIDELMDDMEKLAGRENTRSLQVNLDLIPTYKPVSC